MKKILAFAVLAIMASGSAFAQTYGTGASGNPEDADVTINATATVIVPLSLSASGGTFTFGTINRNTLPFAAPASATVNVPSTNTINLTVTGDANDVIGVSYPGTTTMAYTGGLPAAQTTGQDLSIETSFSQTGTLALTTGVSNGTGTTVLAITGQATIAKSQQRGSYSGNMNVLVDYVP